MLTEAQSIATKMDDQFVTVEHLVLAMMGGEDETAKLFRQNNIKEKDLRTAIEDLRKGDRVTKQNQEDTYQALEKYAKNLNELARRSSAGTRKSGACCRSLPAVPRTTRSLSVNRVWEKRP